MVQKKENPEDSDGVMLHLPHHLADAHVRACPLPRGYSYCLR